MRPATAVALLVAGIGCLLVLTAGPRLVLYWALVIPSVLSLYLIDGPWDLAIAIIAGIVFLAGVARARLRHRHASAPSRGAIAGEETT